MMVLNLRHVGRYGLALLLVAGLCSMGSKSYADSKKPAAPAPAKAAPAARPAAAARPASGSAPHTSGGASGPSASHSPSANSGPSANGAGSHVPSANAPSANNARSTTSAGAVNTHSIPGSAASRPGAASGPIHSAAPRGSVEHASKNGSAIRTRPNGRVSDIHDAKRGMDVHNGLNGNRRVSVERADHSRIVSERGRAGYVQHPYGFRGHDFGRRSYYYHGRAYDRFYRGHYYHGVYMDVYAPAFYYGAGFYGWAYNPWAAPITFSWGWGGSPWYGHYGYYFAPYPVYPSASYWLTDYMISTDLQASYAAQQEAGEVDGAAPVAAGGQPMMTPDVKQQIADEVRAQLALENHEADMNKQSQDADPVSSGIGRMFSDGHAHVFLVANPLDVVDASGMECSISDGDALQLQTPPDADATAADLVVLSSKGGQECRKTATVTIALSDLQEMQNHMRETIDQGLQDLQAKQGKDGIPVLPPSAQVQTTPALYAAAAPPPDPNALAEIQQQTQQADQAQKDVTADVTQDTGSPASFAPSNAAPVAPASVEMGQSLDQVQSELGAPSRVANLGPKVIYYYNNMKVVFKDGKVSDVQ